MKKEALTIRLTTELKQKLKRKAEKEGQTINSIIVQILWKEV